LMHNFFQSDEWWLSTSTQSYMPSLPIGCWILSFGWLWWWHPHTALFKGQVSGIILGCSFLYTPGRF
jgi:hypothetical protein